MLDLSRIKWLEDTIEDGEEFEISIGKGHISLYARTKRKLEEPKFMKLGFLDGQLLLFRAEKGEKNALEVNKSSGITITDRAKKFREELGIDINQKPPVKYSGTYNLENDCLVINVSVNNEQAAS